MEIKITADKALLAVLDRISDQLTALLSGDAISAHQAPPAAPVAAVSPAPDTTAPAEPEPPTAAPEAASEAAPAIDRETVRQLSVTKIQAGKRDAIKALLVRYGATRVGSVAEDKLAAFAAELEAL